MDFFDQSDLKFKGMLSQVSWSHLILGQVLEMVRIMSIHTAESASMVCSQ